MTPSRTRQVFICFKTDGFPIRYKLATGCSPAIGYVLGSDFATRFTQQPRTTRDLFIRIASKLESLDLICLELATFHSC